MSMVRFDLPTPEGDTIEFWEAAKEERLLIKHCNDCGAYSYYPRPFCPKLLERERRVVRGQRRGHALHLVGDLQQRHAALQGARCPTWPPSSTWPKGRA